jgi:hypothetical protein
MDIKSKVVILSIINVTKNVDSGVGYENKFRKKEWSIGMGNFFF